VTLLRAALVVAAWSLGGCVLMAPADVDFFEGPVLDDGSLVREFRFDDGSPECRAEFDVDRGYADPVGGCSACEVELSVDFEPIGDDCASMPSGWGNASYDLSIGFDGDEAWSRESGVWELWMTGDGGSGRFEGDGDWRPEAGFDVRDRLDVDWFGD
jgi:hypothetical protein